MRSLSKRVASSSRVRQSFLRRVSVRKGISSPWDRRSSFRDRKEAPVCWKSPTTPISFRTLDLTPESVLKVQPSRLLQTSEMTSKTIAQAINEPAGGLVTMPLDPTMGKAYVMEGGSHFCGRTAKGRYLDLSHLVLCRTFPAYRSLQGFPDSEHSVSHGTGFFGGRLRRPFRDLA